MPTTRFLPRLVISALISVLVVLVTTMLAGLVPKLEFLTYPGLWLAWLVVREGVHSDSILGGLVGFIGLFAEWITYTGLLVLAIYAVDHLRRKSG